MTNEELCVIIQSGNADELIPILWEKVYKVMYKLSDSLFERNADVFKRRGMDKYDLRQESYSAFLKAIKAYDPKKDIKLTSYFRLSLLSDKHIRAKKKRDIIDIADSLDYAGESAEGEDLSYHEIIPDESAALVFDDVDKRITERKIWAEVDKLKERQRVILHERFENNSTLEAIGKQLGISRERVRTTEAKALRALRVRKNVQAIGHNLGYGIKGLYHDGYGRYKRRGITSLELIAMARADAHYSAYYSQFTDDESKEKFSFIDER